MSLITVSSTVLYSQSLLWKVSGKKLKSPSYLYGSIHIQDKRAFAFDDVVINAFNSTEAFAMEVLLDEVSQKDVQAALLMKDNTIENLLGKKKYKILDSIVKAKTGQGMFIFNKMKPFFLSSQLEQMSISKDMELALDLHFLNLARKADKSCYGVEKFKDQVKAVDAISLKEQAEMLYKGLTDTAKKDAEKEVNELIEAYLNFDFDKLLKLSTDTVALPKNFAKTFLIDRNYKMVKSFIKIANKQSLFCVVGAAHLCGKDGLITILRQKGYIVEAVPFKWIDK